MAGKPEILRALEGLPQDSLQEVKAFIDSLKKQNGKKTRPKEKWDYGPLEWIHRARAQIYKAEKKQPLTEISPRLSPGAAALARRLKLKTIRAADLPKRRSQTG
ncbi:MAG: hypothetical protein HYW03_11120 [Deltaproteobacteria bacterium]|nr:hypothetical protein [Deltaproteobacteria bacterium]